MKIVLSMDEVKEFLMWLYGFDEKSFSNGWFPAYAVHCDQESGLIEIDIKEGSNG